MGEHKVIWIGRLEKDTGLPEFLRWFRSLDGYGVGFVGDGALRKKCEKYGRVHGFTDPQSFLKEAEICVPGGYLSYIEAKQYGCKIKVFPNNPLKKDYWDEIQKVKKFPTWDQLADEYLDLYNSSE